MSLPHYSDSRVRHRIWGCMSVGIDGSAQQRSSFRASPSAMPRLVASAALQILTVFGQMLTASKNPNSLVIDLVISADGEPCCMRVDLTWPIPEKVKAN